MVLLGTSKLSSAYGLCRGAGKKLQFEAYNNLTLRAIFVDLCQECQLRAMASIPPSAFSAGRIRETQRDRDMKVSNTAKGRNNDPNKFFNTSLMEPSPLKYISKLMNSIWGNYNRYSPHNVKKITESLSLVFDVEFPKSGNPTKSEPVVALPPSKFDKVWAAINLPQSH